MLSVIIPSYYDPYLKKTVNSILKSSRGEIEIIAVQDGPVTKPPINTTDKRVKLVILPNNIGMRGAINTGIARARGKYIMKCDSHCAFAAGFDKILTQNCDTNQLMIPRRYSLNEIRWCRNLAREFRDYHYLKFPALTTKDWFYKGRAKIKYEIDDTLTFQGSCWLANRKYFMKRVGYLDDRPEAYGPFGGEQVEIGLKYWLGGGEVKVNKKTWYAHLGKRPFHYMAGIFSRSYKYNRAIRANRAWYAKHWLNNEEPGMIHPISWLIEKFWPIPEWPENRFQWRYPL